MQYLKRPLNSLLLISFLLISSSCEDCTIDPDLIPDLLAPTSDIIKNEPVDWDYVIESVEDNSQDCDILLTTASIGKILIEFFTDQNDTEGETLASQTNDIGQLNPGEAQTVNNTFSVFNEVGIYMIAVNADDTNVVSERKEDNNTDTGEATVNGRLSDDLFRNASPAFKEKLIQAAALVIVGDVLEGNKPQSYQGKPIYYAE